eukprot:1340403-Amorphochlora_amoeboformis.AAC.2
MARPWRAMAPLVRFPAFVYFHFPGYKLLNQVLLATAITILPPSYQAFPPNIPFSNRHLGGGIVAAFQGAATALVVRPVSLIFQPFKILQRTARRHRRVGKGFGGEKEYRYSVTAWDLLFVSLVAFGVKGN